MANVDYIEVDRIAYELQERMGWTVARKYAARLGAEALADGILEEDEFWRAVEASLTPRAQPISSGAQI